MANAVAPETQDEERNNGVIGIGTDGNPVDMDLWKYTLLDDGFFMLNKKETEGDRSPGYIGNFSETGEILGTIPQYISTDNGKSYKAVSDLNDLFRGCSNLKIAPKIPNTIKNMACTFELTSIGNAPAIPFGVENLAWTFGSCTNLVAMPYIPDSVTALNGCFAGCSKITKLLKLPDSITRLDSTFRDCTGLEEVPNYFAMPKNVTTIQLMFYNCTNLKRIPENFKISGKIENVVQTFGFCNKLEGSILLDMTPTTYTNCFQKTSTETENKLKINYTSNCTNIDEIISVSHYTNAVKGELLQL